MGKGAELCIPEASGFPMSPLSGSAGSSGLLSSQAPLSHLSLGGASRSPLRLIPVTLSIFSTAPTC